jgi:hypothetical protein
MAIADDLSVAVSGDIRWTGTGADQYTVLELHRFLQDLADDESASGDDLVDITTSTPSTRSTDNIITLINGFNIDDEVAEHLYDGSIDQNSGDDVYSGLVVVGTVEGGTEIQIIRDNKILTPYYGTGLNADAANNIIMRLCIKTREDGADIDRQSLRLQARELGDTYAEFSLTAGLGNSTAAIFTSGDLNNATVEGTIAGWTTISNVEGFQDIDITGDGATEEYYSQWNIGSQTINDTYERAKWISQRGLSEDTNADTGTDFIVDNATILGQGQSFQVGNDGIDKKVVRVDFNLKVGNGTPTGDMTAEIYAHSGTYGTSSIATGAVLATSEPISSDRLLSTYQTFTFVFYDNISLTTNTNYVCVIRHPNGDATNRVAVEGLATTGTHGGNRTEDTGTWAAVALDDLNFTVYTSPEHHSMAGELFRGITHEIVYDTEAGGPFTEDEVIVWGTDITYDALAGGTFTEGAYVTIGASGAAGKVLYDNGTTNMIVALEDTSITLIDDDVITGLGVDAGVTAAINVTILNNDKSGGEGHLIALDDNGANGDFYIQLLSGAAPVDTIPLRGLSSSATAEVNITVTSRTISPEFIGASTGSNLIGAYGIGFETTDVTANDQFFDLTNTLRQPPNNVTFSVTGLIAQEDRVLVGPRQAGVLDLDQLATDTSLTVADESLIQCSTAIPDDTPNIGTVRVELDSGIYKRVRYSSYAVNDFTIIPDNAFVDGDVTLGSDQITQTAHDFRTGDHVQLTTDGTLPSPLATATDYYIIVVDPNEVQLATTLANAHAGTQIDITALNTGNHVMEAMSRDFSSDNSSQPKNVFISYIDELADAGTESYTAVYNTDRDLLVRVRDGGSTPIVTFETPATFGSSNSSIAAIRNTDL